MKSNMYLLCGGCVAEPAASLRCSSGVEGPCDGTGNWASGTGNDIGGGGCWAAFKLVKVAEEPAASLRCSSGIP